MTSKVFTKSKINGDETPAISMLAVRIISVNVNYFYSSEISG